MNTRVRHVGIVVKDIEYFKNFFIDVFHLREVADQYETGEFIDNLLGMSQVNVRTIKLSDDANCMIELLHFQETDDYSIENVKNPNTRGITHIALTVTSVEKTLIALNKQGFLPLDSPGISVDGKVCAAYIRGPESILFEIVEELR
jgi:catechol 2,3-dioxygenase-like lactoylglutathione lyase family enzyme